MFSVYALASIPCCVWVIVNLSQIGAYHIYNKGAE